MRYYTIEDVQRDWRCLNADDFSAPRNIRLISHERYSKVNDGLPDVECIEPRGLAALGRFLPETLCNACFAWQLLKQASPNTVIICNGGNLVGKLVGVLNYLFLIRKRRIVQFDCFVETRSRVKKWLTRCMIRGCTTVAVYGRELLRSQARYIGLPEQMFVFLPYKSNHSKSPPLKMNLGNYIFSGGNSERDYCTLCDAVAGTEIPLIVSVTDPVVSRNLAVPENVVLVAAREPAFARLMASSRFAVFAIRRGSINGGASASICNAMWHGKPVIAADGLVGTDYIQEGVTGHVVPAGDVSALRRRIIALWNDPTRVSQMGQQAHVHVASQFTHSHFIHRLKRLALVVGNT